jgi:hypothetical protein
VPFFPRVLEHLVGLGRGVGQPGARQVGEGQPLQGVPQAQQVAAAAAQIMFD